MKPSYNRSKEIKFLSGEKGETLLHLCRGRIQEPYIIGVHPVVKDRQCQWVLFSTDHSLLDKILNKLQNFLPLTMYDLRWVGEDICGFHRLLFRKFKTSNFLTKHRVKLSVRFLDSVGRDQSPDTNIGRAVTNGFKFARIHPQTPSLP